MNILAHDAVHKDCYADRYQHIHLLLWFVQCHCVAAPFAVSTIGGVHRADAFVKKVMIVPYVVVVRAFKSSDFS